MVRAIVSFIPAKCGLEMIRLARERLDELEEELSEDQHG